jgi:biopolymer transport protein TolR
MAAYVNRGGGSRLSEINVTPLVDVMLVLLVIFMVTAPMLEQNQSQINVDLPQVIAAPTNIAEDAIVITVDRGRKVFINDRPIDPAELKARLIGLFKGRTRKEVFLRADRAVPYGEVVKAMAAIREAGITRLNMVTDPVDGSPGKSSPGKRKR